MDEENEWYDFLVDNEIATEGEVALVCDVAGYSVETLSNILYARTGHETQEQFLGIEEEEEEEED